MLWQCTTIMHLALPLGWWQLPQHWSCCLHRSSSFSSSHIFCCKPIQSLLNARLCHWALFSWKQMDMCSFLLSPAIAPIVSFLFLQFFSPLFFILNGSLFLCNAVLTDTPSLWAHFQGHFHRLGPYLASGTVFPWAIWLPLCAAHQAQRTHALGLPGL